MAHRNRIEDLRFADVVTFLAVRRRGTVTAAARELEVTPSQVSKAVTRLESLLKLRLLVRGSRGVVVSEGAQRLVPHFEEMVSRLRKVQLSEVPTQREVTVAAPSWLNAFFLPTFAQALPEVRLRGLQLAPALVRAYATENFFDVALSAGLERLPRSWQSVHVGSIRQSLFGQPALVNGLGKQPVPVERLKAVPFISPIYNADGQFVPVDDGCPLPYDDRKLGHEVSTIGMGLDLAVAVPQLVFGPVVAASEHLRRGLLSEVVVRTWNVSEPLYLACNQDRVMASVQRTLLQTMRDALGKLTRLNPDGDGDL